MTRQLVALASSLSQEGKTIRAQDIVQAFDVTYDQARHLIVLLAMGSGESIDYLPVVLGERDDEVSLMTGAALVGRRVRLTKAEATALMAALAQAGMADDDPLVQALVSAFVTPDLSLEDMRRSLESPNLQANTPALERCSRAIETGSGLSFAYTPISGGSKHTRRVVPKGVRPSHDGWFLDAYDLERKANRVFRMDRMGGLETFELESIPRKHDDSDAPQKVLVHFGDPHVLQLFNWKDLEVIASDEDGVLAQLPYFGGAWLPLHLLACDGTAQVDSASIAQQMQQLAQGLL